MPTTDQPYTPSEEFEIAFDRFKAHTEEGGAPVFSDQETVVEYVLSLREDLASAAATPSREQIADALMGYEYGDDWRDWSRHSSRVRLFAEQRAEVVLALLTDAKRSEKGEN